MPLPIVRPKRKRWYNLDASTRSKRFGQEVTRQDFVAKIDGKVISQKRVNPMVANVDDYIKLNRRKFYLVDDFDEGIFDELDKKLKSVQFSLAAACTEKLRELIEDRAYVEYNTGNESAWYNRSYQFPDAFDVFVFIKPNRLDYKINFYYESLKTASASRRKFRVSESEAAGEEWSENDEGGVSEYKEQMARYLSIYGVDMRKDLPDILNTPVTVYRTQLIKDRRKRKRTWEGSVNKYALKKAGKREGRWYQTFDRWFRTDGYELFKSLCVAYKVI